MRRLLRRLASDRRGLGAVEFALIMPVFFLLIFTIAQAGRLYFAHAAVRHSVSEGARLATLYPRPSTEQIQARMVDSRFGLHPERVSASTVTYGKNGTADFADIALTYTVPVDLIFYKPDPVTISYSRRVYVQPLI